MPKIALNQFFEKPIKPKQLALTTKINVESTEKSIRLLKIQNSIENFKVPGNPAKNIHIKKIAIDMFGKNETIPFTCNIDLE